jgi:PIN domain nuclease of toxin-antitoxin system
LGNRTACTKGKIELSNVKQWKDELLAHTSIKLLTHDADDMIASVRLPLHHKDPFDRLFIAQALAHNCILISKDGLFKNYGVPLLWM